MSLRNETVGVWFGGYIDNIMTELSAPVELKTITCFLMKLTATPAKLNTGRFKNAGSLRIKVKINRLTPRIELVVIEMNVIKQKGISK